jgi:hypothetical protein
VRTRSCCVDRRVAGSCASRTNTNGAASVQPQPDATG